MYPYIAFYCENEDIPESERLAGEFECIDRQWYGDYDASVCGDYKKPYIVTSIYVGILQRIHMIPLRTVLYFTVYCENKLILNSTTSKELIKKELIIFI